MPRPRETIRHRAMVAAVQQEIARCYRDPDLALEDVAAVVGKSERQLQRVLKAQTGLTFRETLLGYRMAKARALLERGLAVRAVARRVGYRNASGLGQAFRRFYDEPPSAAHPPPPSYDDEWRERETIAAQR